MKARQRLAARGRTCRTLHESGTFTDAIFAYGAAHGVPWLRMTRHQKQGIARLSVGGRGCECRVVDIPAAHIDEFLKGRGGSWRGLTENDIAVGKGPWSS